MTGNGGEDRAERLRRAIRLKKAARREEPQVPAPRPPDEPALLGEMQRSLWLAHQMDPASPAYNLSSAFRVQGPLDVDRLQGALDRVVARHRLLRSTFRSSGADVHQVVHPEAPVRIEVLQAGEGGGRAAAVVEARAPFDLESGPLVRVRVIEEAPGTERLLLLVLHHILADERSLASLWRELGEAYEDRPGIEPAWQYDDYVHWRRRSGEGERERALDHWRRHLDPLPDDLRLPFEKRSDGTGKARGRLLARGVKGDPRPGLHRLAAASGATPFMVYAFAFRLLLQRYAQEPRVAFGTPVSTRAHPAAETMLGYFLNPVVVCASLDEGAGVEEALRAFSGEMRDALAHAAAPFDEVAGLLSPPRPRGRHPLFQAMFVYQELAPPPRLGDARLEPVTLDLKASKFDLTLFVTEGPGPVEIAVEYRADRFEAVWMEGLLDHYETLLENLGEGLEIPVAAVPLLRKEEEDRLLARARGPRLSEGPRTLLPEQIRDQARRRPRDPAVVCGGELLSYADLEGSAGTVARALAARGVRPGDRVGLFLPRSAGLIAGVVGCHWAGAAYVPLDPSYPPARNRMVLQDAGVKAMVTTQALRGRLPDGSPATVEIDAPGEARDPPIALGDLSPDSPAYILYTSGSSGSPKGVVVSHENLRLSTAARLQVYAAPPGRFLLLPSVAFDSSVAGIFWTLATGGTLVVPTEDEIGDLDRLAARVERARVSSLLVVPSLYRRLVAAGSPRLKGLETAIVAGEICPPGLVEEHFQALPHVRLFNEYGPTEATVWASVHEAAADDREGPVPIGRPIPGAHIEVLDPLGRRVPTGIPGQAWIGGPTVAQGYWQRPDLTAERFAGETSDAGGGPRRYRTGDRVTWTADGRLLFLGREDEQVKLRGFRIEPGEIEAAVKELPSVEGAAVVVRDGGGDEEDPGRARLVAFVEGGGDGAPAHWRAELARRLPDHMIPSRLVRLPELPRLPNGKVDRKGLRALPLDPETPDRSPASRVLDTREQDLISLWEGLLGRRGIGPSDNFFELGGHSLLVMEMTHAIERDRGVRLAASDVFENPTVQQLARRIERGGEPGSVPYRHLFPIQPGGSRTPLIFAIPHVFTDMLARRFRGERPVYGLRGVGLRPEGNRGRWPTLTDLATELVDEVLRRFPGDGFLVGGYSFGASMAIEAVRIMERRGVPVRRLYVIAPMPLDLYPFGPLRLQIDGLRRPVGELTTAEALRLLARSNHPLTRRPYRRAWRWVGIEPWRRALCLVGRLRRAAGLPLTPGILHADVRVERFRLHARYEPGPIQAPTVIFNPSDTPTDAAATWRPWFRGPLTVLPTPDPHDAASEGEARRVILRHLEDLGDL